MNYLEENFIAAADVQPDAFFLREFAFRLSAIDVYTSEAARAEAVIFPILRGVYKGYHERFALWIQKAIAYDTQLSGTPDYLPELAGSYEIVTGDSFTKNIEGLTVDQLPRLFGALHFVFDALAGQSKEALP